MPAETHSHGFAQDPAALEAVTRERLAEHLGCPPEPLQREKNLSEFGATELDVLHVVASLGEDYGERTLGTDDDLDLQELETVGDLFDYVIARFG